MIAGLPFVLEGFFEGAMNLSKAIPFAKGIIPVIELSQRVAQALSLDAPSIMQIPHVTSEVGRR